MASDWQQAAADIARGVSHLDQFQETGKPLFRSLGSYRQLLLDCGIGERVADEIVLAQAKAVGLVPGSDG